MNVMTLEMRSLPTGTWHRVGDDEWAKQCGKCGGKGYLPGYEYIDNARCWQCGTSGFQPCARKTTAQLDRKAIADEKAARVREAKRAAEAALWIAKAAVIEAEEAAREAVRVAERQTKIDASHHLDAAEGDKVEVTGTVVLARSYEAQSFSGWGSEIKRIIAVDLGAGVTVKAFTAAGWAFEVAEGDQVTLAATVKSHGDYEGIKETTVTRPRMVAHTPKVEAE